MKVLTCNIRYEAANDGDDSWCNRRDYASDVIRQQCADIICFQELSAGQCDYMRQAMPEMGVYGLVDEALGHNPTNAIFYRLSAFGLIAPGGYWLSETPHITGSSSWESACVRLCNWLRLEHRESGRELRILNTHLDHDNQRAREQQARVIIEDTMAFPDDYVQILTGDMNCDANNPAMIRVALAGWRDTFAELYGPDDPGPTFHGFRGPDSTSDLTKIDFILARGDVTVSRSEIIRDHGTKVDGSPRYPSDHYFVTATFKF